MMKDAQCRACSEEGKILSLAWRGSALGLEGPLSLDQQRWAEENPRVFGPKGKRVRYQFLWSAFHSFSGEEWE